MGKWIKTLNVDHKEQIINIDCIAMLNTLQNANIETYWVYLKGVDAPFRVLSTTYYAIRKAIGLGEQDDE